MVVGGPCPPILLAAGWRALPALRRTGVLGRSGMPAGSPAFLYSGPAMALSGRAASRGTNEPPWEETKR